MVKDATRANEKLFIQWATDTGSMVAIEALCAAWERHPPDERIHLTLAIEGEKSPSLSELKKILLGLEPLMQRGGAFDIYCEYPVTQKLLEFCGFPLIAQFLTERPSVSNHVGKAALQSAS